MKKFFKKFKWVITLGVVLVGAFTGIDLAPVQKAVEDSVIDSTEVRQSSDELGDSIVNDSTEVRQSSDELGDFIVNDSICYSPVNSVNYEK